VFAVESRRRKPREREFHDSFQLITFRSVLALPLANHPLYVLFTHSRPQTAPPGQDKPFVIEVLLQGKEWGRGRVPDLFKKNHLPILKKEVEMGRMLKVSMVQPVYHTTEDSRWDFRVTIVYKNAAIAHDSFDSASLIKQLYPDQDTYKKEEQHRFEILDAHWDLPIKDVDTDAR
jgi:hypothetical protein